jgi:hypothetical protein
MIGKDIRTSHSVVEKMFVTDEGFGGVCVFNGTGHRCGYVGVPPTHSLSQKYYDDIGFYPEVHGGLTFSGNLSYFPDSTLHFFGFDCGHAFDGKDIPAMEEYKLEGWKEVLKFETEMRQSFPSKDKDIVRTLEFVVSEVRLLSEQLTPHGIMKAMMV